MASVNFKGGKCHGAGEAKAIMRHCEKEERLKHEHSNPHIDKSKTDQNTSLYGLSYEEMCEKYDARIKLLDATTNTNHRSDRVTMFSLYTPVPEDLPDELADSFLSDVEKIIIEQYGEQNVIESIRHHDEKHKYMDHGVWKMSRSHLHSCIIPEIDGVLNGKQFSSKKNMNKLNKAIEEMSVQKYHMSFLTGKEARGLTVEEAKHKSRIEEYEATLERQAAQNIEQKAENAELKQEKDDIEEQVHDGRMELELINAEEAEAKKRIAEKEKRIAQLDQEIEGRELKKDELTALEQKTFWSSEDKRNVLKTAYMEEKRTREVKSLKEKNKALEKDVKRMTPKYQDYNRVKAQVDQRDKEQLELEKKVKRLEREVKVRDDFIKQKGLMDQFIDFCTEIGHKLKIAVQEISQSLRR